LICKVRKTAPILPRGFYHWHLLVNEGEEESKSRAAVDD
jgi:hypothetical protein